MKTLIFILALGSLVAGCKEAEQPAHDAVAESAPDGVEENETVDAKRMPRTSIRFEAYTHDFGTLQEGAPAKHRFTFTNEGKHPLHLGHVEASCGCTTPQWSKDAIAPGAQGFIDVEFNSRGKRGQTFNKTITVHANTQPEVTKLSITGEVQ
ncbi:MAG: DUF1573 domain-containing protein [Sphingobacteriia bacterium]